MNPHLQRALVLIQQSRTDLAEEELRRALLDDPQDALAHAMLAVCLNARDKHREATEEAERAIHLAPDEPFPHYVRGVSLHARNRVREALPSIEEAIQLDPHDARYRAALARLRLSEKDWKGAAAAAEEGLRIDPEDDDCTNVRAQALVKLGQSDDARRLLAGNLARDPDNASSHANLGWTLLEQGDHEQARVHFREALRLEPGNEWARSGLLEGMRARNIVYRGMLNYFLWMGKHGRSVQWAIIIGFLFGQRILRQLAVQIPALGPFIWPIYFGFLGFALLTWIAEPLFTLVIRFDRFGRLTLRRHEVWASNCVLACVLLAVAGIGGGLYFDHFVPLIGGVMILLWMLPLTATFRCEFGWPQLAMAGITFALGVVGVAALTFTLLEPGRGADYFKYFFIGSFLSQFAANAFYTIGGHFGDRSAHLRC